MAIGSSYSYSNNNNDNGTKRPERDAAQAEEQKQPSLQGSSSSPSSSAFHRHQHHHHHHERTGSNGSNGTNGCSKKSVRRSYDYWSFGTSMSERSGGSSSCSSTNNFHDSWTSQESAEIDNDNDINVAAVTERSLLLPSTVEQQTSKHDPSIPLLDVEQGNDQAGGSKDNNNNKKYSKDAAPSWKKLSHRAVGALGVESSKTENASEAGDEMDDWSRKREQAQEWIRSHMDLTLSQCFVGIALYLVVAVVFFSCILPTKWSITDSIYFAIVSFTTGTYVRMIACPCALRCVDFDLKNQCILLPNFLFFYTH